MLLNDCYLLLATCYSLLTTYYLPLTTHHSPPTTHHSPLTAQAGLKQFKEEEAFVVRHHLYHIPTRVGRTYHLAIVLSYHLTILPSYYLTIILYAYRRATWLATSATWLTLTLPLTMCTGAPLRWQRLLHGRALSRQEQRHAPRRLRECPVRQR